ncbi:MAG: NmrA family transcriptional regulator, partial [Acidimicrobiia bacterium]|nr:NmrA family transcriptional regulator [Acidimicrobiia bacterium]
MTDTQPKPILVLGASGKTGRRVTDRLTAAGRPV